MKKSLVIAGAVSAVALAPLSAQAFEFKVSGQVNQLISFGGDTLETEFFDNTTTGTRFRIVGSQAINDNLKAGFRYEAQKQDNASHTAEDSGSFEIRVSQVSLSGGFGKVVLGKGTTISDGSFEAYGLVNYMGGAGSWLGINGNLATGAAYRDGDGLSRGNVLQYHTPNFNGFSAAIGQNSGGGTGVALRYKGKVAGGTLVANIATDESDKSGRDFTGGSIAYKHSSGISASYSSGEYDNNGVESDWLMVGYTFGKTTVSYGTGSSGAGVDNDMDVIGLNYKPTKGMEIYLQRNSFDNADGTSGDAMSLGSRIKF